MVRMPSGKETKAKTGSLPLISHLPGTQNCHDKKIPLLTPIHRFLMSKMSAAYFSNAILNSKASSLISVSPHESQLITTKRNQSTPFVAFRGCPRHKALPLRFYEGFVRNLLVVESGVVSYYEKNSRHSANSFSS
jgi:hypothetical protein